MSSLFVGQLNPSEAAHLFDTVQSLRNFYRDERTNDVEFDINEIKSDILGNNGSQFANYHFTSLSIIIDCFCLETKKHHSFHQFISKNTLRIILTNFF